MAGSKAVVPTSGPESRTLPRPRLSSALRTASSAGVIDMGLLGGLLEPGESVAWLVGDAQPADAGVFLGFDEVFEHGGQALGEIVERGRPAVDAPRRAVAELGEGVPADVAPHLCEEHVAAAPLAPVENAIEDSHLGIVPIELVACGLVHPLLQFDAAPIETEPIGMPLDLLPCLLILGGRIRAPTAAAVADDAAELLVAAGRDRHRLLDGMKRRPHAAAHDVDHLGGVHFHAHFGAARPICVWKQKTHTGRKQGRARSEETILRLSWEAILFELV